MAALDDLGRVRAKYEYGPFGETLTSEGDLAADNPIRWSTKYTDGESGLVYYGYRYYNAGTGRWLSRDPIEEQGGVNLSGFVNNSPLQSIDFLGQKRYIIAMRGAGTSWLGSVATTTFWKKIIEQEVGSEFIWKEYDHDMGWLAVKQAESILTRTIGKGTPVKPQSGGTDESACSYHSLIVLGYSWGAHAVVDAVSMGFKEKNIIIDLVFTADPVPGAFRRGVFKKHPNVSRPVNFYQELHSTDVSFVDGPRFRGKQISGADVNTRLAKEDFGASKFGIARAAGFGNLPSLMETAEKTAKSGHFSIGLQDDVLKALSDEVQNVPTHRSSWKYR
jgi:RHS repeat-associated protein